MTHQFRLYHDTFVTDIQAQVRLYAHPSGATLVSVSNDDENKSFGVALRTMPASSNGVAHILEHSVLCGSTRYPVKSPFNELLKGSVNTFLNAMTYPDKTVYPVASTNLKDLYNLVSVYMDAVFHPLISEDTLRQEGWRYEFDDNGALTYKGIVYNEMKGASATADRIAGRALMKELMPDTIYAHDSGGYPRDIPSLSYPEFVAFNQTYYHPSNALLFWYGDDDEEPRLAALEPFLATFTAQAAPPPLTTQPAWTEPRSARYTYPATAEEQRNVVTLAWLAQQQLSPVDELEIMIIDDALLGDAASPLRKILLDSGLGENISGGGFGSGLQPYFALGLKGVLPHHVDAVAPMVLDAIETVCQQGVEPEQLAASLNTFEFRARENNTGGFPRGLSLMLNMTEPWLYGNDILAVLNYEQPLAEVRKRLEDPSRTATILRSMVLDNPHRVTLTVSPDAELNATLDAAEAAELQSVEGSLDETGREAIRRDAERLERWQETPDAPEALATVPRLGRADIDTDVKHTPLELHQVHSVPITHAPLFTSGIAYIDFGFDLLQIPARLLPYVPLFLRALTSVGAGAYDMSKQSQRTGTYTGGIGVSSSIGTHRITHQPYGNLFVRGKATLQNVPVLLELMRDIIVSPHMHNKERIMKMVREDKAGREAGILPSGHSYVNTRLRAPYSSNHTFAELTGGATYVAFIRHLAQRGDDAWSDIHAHFTEIQHVLFHHEAMRIHITANPEHGSTIIGHIDAVMPSIPHGTRRPNDWSVAQYAHSEALQLPAQVNYVGVGGALSTIGYTCDGADIVVNRHLSRTFLHEAIREKGGAYGAFSVLDIRTGLLTMLSYRDPNLQKTLDTYRAAGAWLQTVQLDDDALLQAIIGAAGDFDGHQLPDARGFGAMSRLLSGDDDAYRQQVRQQALAVGNHHFARYGAALEAMSTHWRTVVLGGDVALQQQQTQSPGFFEHITTML